MMDRFAECIWVICLKLKKKKKKRNVEIEKLFNETFWFEA